MLVPSRGRPASMVRLSEAFQRTCIEATYLHWIIDEDDPELSAYRDAFQDSKWRFKAFWVVPKGRPGIVHPLNWVVVQFTAENFAELPSYYAFMGDDHEPKTRGWDSMAREKLDEAQTGIVYGDDALQGERLATAAIMTRDIVETLGWMAPPCLDHLYVDDAWMYLGRGLGRLYYLPDMLIEHLHYLNGKAEKDGTYETVNSPAMGRHDRIAFAQWKLTEGPKVLTALRALIQPR